MAAHRMSANLRTMMASNWLDDRDAALVCPLNHFSCVRFHGERDNKLRLDPIEDILVASRASSLIEMIKGGMMGVHVNAISDRPLLGEHIDASCATVNKQTEFMLSM